MKSILACLLSFLILSTSASAETYVIDSTASNPQVKFKSSAKLEFIEGSTSDLEGTVIFDRINHSDSVKAVLRVDLRSLKTGIDLRDEHMRERHLDTDKFPYAYFELSELNQMPQSIVDDSTYEIGGSGYFYIHGVKRKLLPTIHFSFDSESGDMTVSAEFEIKLDEYKIDRPKALFMKLAETIEVEVSFTAAAGSSDKEIQLPEWELLE